MGKPNATGYPEHSLDALFDNILIQNRHPKLADVLDPDPASCWIWTGTYRPKNPTDNFTRQLADKVMVRWPRPITRILGTESNPVGHLMCIATGQPPTERPTDTRRRRSCVDRRCVNPTHWRATRANETIRRRFP